ncbi:MAG: porin [Halioglobus sp.]
MRCDNPVRGVVLSAVLVWGFLSALPALAQATAQSILLRNVTLIDRSGEKETVVVNILVKDSILDIITQDLIPIDEAEESYDAAGGVVLGELTLGEAANFLILSGDPRQNISLLLDTKTHARFAIYQGEVVKNTFVGILEETPEEKDRAQQGWLAYAPPPLAVPLSYNDAARWNHFETKAVSGVFTGGLVVDRQNWVGQDKQSEFQVGDLDEFSGGEIRGLRFGGVGTLNFEKPWVWTIFGATHAFDEGFDSTESDDYTLFDLRLDIPIWEKTSFSIGKQKEPISMERLMALGHGPMQERAAVSDALLPSRNVGLVMAGTLADDRMTLAGGAFNNWLDKDQPNSFSDNATQYVGRATWVPYLSDNESTLLHLGGGLRHSNAKEGVVVQVGPEFNQAPDFLATDSLLPKESMTYQAEASLRSGPFWLHGEYARTDLESREYSDPSLDGYHITASWILTGEVRPYNYRVGIFKPVPVARTVEQNGWGAWEIGARYSNMDMSEAPGSIFGADAGDMDIWSLGLNWWLNPYLNVNLNYRFITLDRFDETGDSHGFNTRLVLLLE